LFNFHIRFHLNLNEAFGSEDDQYGFYMVVLVEHLISSI